MGKDYKNFEKFLLESFNDGKIIRELRLTTDEVNYIEKNLSTVIIEPMDKDNSLDGKAWYKIELSCSINEI